MGKKLTPPDNLKDLPHAAVTQMLALATSGFGLVAALAWNEVVKEFVETRVKPFLPQGSGLVSLILYAVLVTLLAVAVTLQLSRLEMQLKNKKKKK